MKKIEPFIILVLSITGCSGISSISSKISNEKNIEPSVKASVNILPSLNPLVPEKSVFLPRQDSFSLPELTNKVKSVEISKKNITIEINKNISLSALVTIESGEQNSAVDWTSSDSSIANVNSSGIVNAFKKGTVVIKAVSIQNNQTFDSCIVTVVDTESDKPTVVAITNFSGETVLYEKATLKLSGIVKYVNGTFDSNIVWKSSDDSIASVSSDGLVTAIKKGSVTINAVSNKNSSVSSAYYLTIIEKPVPSPTPSPVNLPSVVPTTAPVTDTFNLKFLTPGLTGFNLSWNTFPNAKSYGVYINNELYTNVTSNSVLVTGKASGKKYQVKITALTNQGQSFTSELVNAYTIMADEVLNSECFESGNGTGNWTLGWSSFDKPFNFTKFTQSVINPPNKWWVRSLLGQQFPLAILNPSSDITLSQYNSRLLGKQIAIAPGSNGEFGIVRFTAPVSGKFSFFVKFGSAQPYTSSDVHVVFKENILFSEKLHPSNGPGTQKSETPGEASYLGQLDLLEGETIDFMAGTGNEDFSGDDTTVNVTIKQVQ